MKVLVLGGTSFFGKEIVRAFSSAGHKVTTFSRVKKTSEDGAPHIEGNRTIKEDLLRANKAGPWDLVIDNIAFGAKDITLALDVFKNLKHYILTSTASVYRFVPKDAYHPPVKESDVDFSYVPTEEDQNNSNWIYARGKLEAERTLKKQTAVPFTILRPPVVYGKNDVTARGFWYLDRLLADKEILLANGGNNSFQLCHSADLANVFLLCAQSKASFGKTYNVSMTEVLTLRKFIEISATALEKTPLFKDVPIEEFLENGGPYAKMDNRIYDCTAAKTDLGFIHSPLPGFVRETALWFKEQKKTS